MTSWITTHPVWAVAIAIQAGLLLWVVMMVVGVVTATGFAIALAEDEKARTA